jgi:hypothetical protein
MNKKNEDFVNLMLEKAKNKEEYSSTMSVLSPEKDPAPLAQRAVNEKDIEEVEKFTEQLKKKIQQR